MWLNVVQPSGLEGIGECVEFNLNGGMWHVTASALQAPQFFFVFPLFFVHQKMI